MQNRVINWYNHNQYIRYPFVENADFQIENSALEFSNNLFVDFSATILFETSGALVLDRILVEDTAISFVFKINNTEIVCSLPKIAAEFEIHTFYSDNYSVSFVLGAGFKKWAEQLLNGEYKFLSPPAIEPALIRFVKNYSLLSIKSDLTGAELLNNGPIFIKAGYNCDLSVADNTIYLNAVSGAGAGVFCLPEGNLNNYLYFINNMPANEYGVFKIIGKNGVIVYNENNQLIISLSISKDVLSCGGV